jgi:chemotaxis protein MotB
MPKQVWFFASIFSALVLLGISGLNLYQQSKEIKDLRAQVGQAGTSLESLTNQINLAQKQIDALRQEKDDATKAQKNLELEMRNAIQSKDVTISELQGKLTVNILDRIMFDSGEAVLKTEGEGVLKQIATVLAQFPNRQIHVIGHTDNVPIRAGLRNKYSSNWELSTARATAAVRFLTEKAGVDPRRLGAVGYGEFHPIADNATADGRAKNRRIALVVLSEELAGSDAATMAKELSHHVAGTNAPAATVSNNVPAGTEAILSTNLPAADTNGLHIMDEEDH